MSTTLEKIEYLTKTDDKHWCVFYEPGMRGNSVVRILSAHKESWWDSKFMNNSSENLQPLEMPESLSTFNFLEFGKQNYVLHHTGLMFKDPRTFVPLLKQRPKNNHLYWFTWTHPVFHKYNFPNCRFIYLYASNQNSNRKYTSEKPLNNECAFNIDVSSLFSYDRKIFYEEYTKILNKFEFTPRYGSVRSYILSVLDRDDYYKNYMS